MNNEPAQLGEKCVARHELESSSSMFGRRLSPDVLIRYEHRDDILQVLCEAIAQDALVTICGAHISRPVCGGFLEIQGDRISMTLGSDDETSIGLRSLCTVIFTHNKQQCMFFSVIVSVGKRDANGKCVVATRIPSRVDEVEARWNKRMRMPESLVGQATIETESGVFHAARILDLGRGGTDTSFMGGHAAKVPFGVGLAITLKVGSLEAKMTGELRWRNGDRCGFCFSHFHERPVLNVSRELEDILNLIESMPDSEAA